MFNHPLKNTSDGLPEICIDSPLHFKPTATLDGPGLNIGTDGHSQLTEMTVGLELNMFEELEPHVGVPDSAQVVACCKPKTCQGRHLRQY